MLAKKTAIITGANRGIGKAITKAFYEQGANVYAVTRKENGMNEVFSQWQQEKELERERLHEIILDVRDAKKAKEVFMAVNKEAGSIDILVNNAGIMQDALIGMISEDMIKDLFETNVYPVILLSQLAARFMSRKKQGSIINLASIIGTNGNAGQSVYSATKGAVISFTKSAAKELAPKGIRVNAIAPGIIHTDLLQNVPKESMEARIANIKMGRIGEPEDVAKAAVFLASDLSGYVSGQILGVDGCAVL